MKRLLVNDALTQIPGTCTFWHDLLEWTDAEFLGGPYETLAMAVDAKIDSAATEPSLVIRNASWFPPLKASLSTASETCKECNGPLARCGKHGPAGEPPIIISRGVPTISLLQDIIPDGPQRAMQVQVSRSSAATVFNSEFTYSKYAAEGIIWRVIPLPVDFSLFEPQNAMGCQQALALPDGAVCWIGASRGAAGHIKGWDIFVRVARLNPDIPFVAVLKDAAPESVPPNVRYYVKLAQEELVRVIGACRVGLCTSCSESQHLAGIEMGACGLPIVAPPVGTYWKRDDLPGLLVSPNGEISQYTTAIRSVLALGGSPDATRHYWRREFDKPVIKSAWLKLIEEVECSGAS